MHYPGPCGCARCRSPAAWGTAWLSKGRPTMTETGRPDDDPRTPPLGGEPGELHETERAELERLRAEVAALRASTGAAVPPPADRRPGEPRRGWRWTAVAVLSVLVAVFAVTSVVSRFVRSELLDTDRYVTTVIPLASDPAVQGQIADTITDEIFERVDIEGMTSDALTALADAIPATEDAPRVDRVVDGLAPVITGQARNFVGGTVLSLVESDQFEDLWIQANRAAHEALVAALTGELGPSSVTVDDSGTVSISLGRVIENVKARLLERDFTFAEKIPVIDKQFVLFRSPELIRAQRIVSALDRAADILPWITVTLAVATVAAAPPGCRRRALGLVGLALVAGMFVLAVALVVARAVYLDQVPADVLSPDAAAAVVDAVTIPLRTALRAVAVLGLVLALGAYLTGDSSSAAAVRSGFGRGLDAMRMTRNNRLPNAFETAVFRTRIALRIAILGIAAVLVMFWRYPTGLVVIWIVLGAALALVLLELVIRPARSAHITTETRTGDEGPKANSSSDPPSDDAANRGVP